MNIKDGKWQGFHGKNVDIVFKLTQDKKVKSVEIGFLEDIRSWVFLPSQIIISSSTDGENFKIESSENLNTTEETKPISIYNYHAKLQVTKKIKYIKVQAKSIGNCPEWHYGKGNKSWIFIDEVEIN